VVRFLIKKEKEGASIHQLKLVVKSISQAVLYVHSVQLGKTKLVTDFMSGAIKNATPSAKKLALTIYPDPARILARIWLLGPNENLCLDQLRLKVVGLLFIDLGLRLDDLRSLYRTFPEPHGDNASLDLETEPARLRPYYPKELKVGSSRSNSTNLVWGTWMTLHSTTPVELCTKTTVKEYIRRQEQLDLFHDEALPLLGIRAIPLVHGTRIGPENKFLPPSKDYLSNLFMHLMTEAGIHNVDTRNVRGMSGSKVVAVAPSLRKEVVANGRWTDESTFRTTYEKPVKLLSAAAVSAAVVESKNLQQCIRHGLELKPPDRITAADFLRHHEYWVGKSIPWFGTVLKFAEGEFKVKLASGKTKNWTHYQFFVELSKWKSTSTRS
jgi:hypothetical protein